MLLDLYPHKCKQCGKYFKCSKQYVYKAGIRKGIVWFCSYKCLRAYETEDHGEKRKYQAMGIGKKTRAG